MCVSFSSRILFIFVFSSGLNIEMQPDALADLVAKSQQRDGFETRIISRFPRILSVCDEREF